YCVPRSFFRLLWIGGLIGRSVAILHSHRERIAMNYRCMVLGVSVCVCSLTNPTARNCESDAVGGEAKTNPPSSPDWMRGKFNLLQPVWGLRGGLLFSIHPGGTNRTSG